MRLKLDELPGQSADDPQPPPGVPSVPWNARLSLGYARRGAQTIPVLRSHYGPLRIQKGFTPEGPDLWHQVIVHPPGGIASGDALAIDIEAQPGARALITSPGAAKWYRANVNVSEQTASQHIHCRVAEGASLEWLPLESIVFPGAQAVWQNRFDLVGDATLMAAELVCLGRPAADLPFAQGSIRGATEVRRDGHLLFHEQMCIDGGDPLMQSAAGLAGAQAFGSLLMAGRAQILTEVLDRVRSLADPSFEGDWAITSVPGLAILRWRGPGAEAGWRVLRAAWAISRPLLIGRSACFPRIWAT